MMNESVIYILLSLSSVTVLFAGFFLFRVVRELSCVARTQSEALERLSQSVIAYKASSEIHPSTGPAILQQVNKLAGLATLNEAPVVDEKAERIKDELEQQEEKERRGGVSVKRGPV